jgi:hypothetical protein
VELKELHLARLFVRRRRESGGGSCGTVFLHEADKREAVELLSRQGRNNLSAKGCGEKPLRDKFGERRRVIPAMPMLREVCSRADSFESLRIQVRV